jgi:hypothetical protein
MELFRDAGAGEALRWLRTKALALRARTAMFCFIVSALFCLVAVGLLTVISVSVLGDVLSGR